MPKKPRRKPSKNLTNRKVNNRINNNSKIKKEDGSSERIGAQRNTRRRTLDADKIEEEFICRDKNTDESNNETKKNFTGIKKQKDEKNFLNGKPESSFPTEKVLQKNLKENIHSKLSNVTKNQKGKLSTMCHQDNLDEGNKGKGLKFKTSRKESIDSQNTSYIGESDINTLSYNPTKELEADHAEDTSIKKNAPWRRTRKRKISEIEKIEKEISDESSKITDCDKTIKVKGQINVEIMDESKITVSNDVSDVALSASIISIPKKKKGRPLKILKNVTPAEISVATEQSFENTDYKQKFRTRKSNTDKLITKKEFSSDDDDDDDDDVLSDSESDTEPLKNNQKNVHSRLKRKRGRPKGTDKKNNSDTEYVPHHEYLRVPSETKKENVKSTVSTSKVKVTCAKCNVEMFKSQWSNHNLKLHHQLGWLEGSPNPGYDNNEKLTRKILFIAIKKKKGMLQCEKCDQVRRSVDGYLSHVQMCGKSEEEKKKLLEVCPGCQELVTAPTLKYHMTVKHVKDKPIKKEIKESKQENSTSNSRSTVNNSELRTKRKAAEKATNKISEFTALSKDDNDSSKKPKINKFLKKMVLKPKLKKTVPSILQSKWKKDLENKQIAVCSQPGCQFSCKSFEEMSNHYSQCNFTPQKNFFCKICKFNTLEKDQIVKHMIKRHPIEEMDDYVVSSESDDDNDSFDSDEVNDKEIVKGPSSSRRSDYVPKNNFDSECCRKSTFNFIINNSNYRKSDYIFVKAFKWSLDFEQKNYQFYLFQEYKPKGFKLLDEKLIEFLPELTESMSMKMIKENKNNPKTEWKKWKRFEGNSNNGGPMFFVGGPVWALAWLPIPSTMGFSENISQFIAISTHKSMEAEFLIGESYGGKNIIQIWNVGNLNHKDGSQSPPKLEYAIAHEGGTVWSLEWCPSGCYNHENLSGFSKKNYSKRLGLLAAACSDGCIRVYSLTFPEDLPLTGDVIQSSLKNEENTSYPIYNTDPVLILIVNFSMYNNKKQNWQATKLSWAKEKNHDIIVAGFSNGYVGLWDITSKSPLLRYKKNDIVFLQPYRYFVAHLHAVTMVYLVPQDEKRFLVTASLDRKYKFWDLEDISDAQSSFQRSFVTDGAWLNNWGCAFLAYDDGLSWNNNFSYCVPLREYTYNHFNILHSHSTSYAIATSDFGNSIATGTTAGNVFAMFPFQLLYIRDMEKTLRFKRSKSLIASVEVFDFHNKNNKNEELLEEDYNFKPSTYNESKERFGLIFHDKIDNFRHGLSKSESVRKARHNMDPIKNIPIEQYPFTSVNRVSWNPNAWSFLWLAVGYQNGFVQLLSFKSFACMSEWNTMLQSHIDQFESNSEENTSIS